MNHSSLYLALLIAACTFETIVSESAMSDVDTSKPRSSIQVTTSTRSQIKGLIIQCAFSLNANHKRFFQRENTMTVVITYFNSDGTEIKTVDDILFLSHQTARAKQQVCGTILTPRPPPNAVYYSVSINHSSLRTARHLIPPPSDNCRD